MDTSSREFLIQCEARAILKLPTKKQRQEELAHPARAKRVKLLKTEMKRQFDEKKAMQNTQQGALFA